MTDIVSGVDPSFSRDIDLSGVAPLRRAETRRRIDEIRAYLSIPAPVDSDRAAAASRLGIGTQQFMSLVRAWTAHGEAVAIAKAGAAVGAARGVRRRGLPRTTRSAAEEALRVLPASASHKDAIAAVEAACRRRRTRPPSGSMVSYLRMQLRRSGGTADGAPGIIVGRATASLPMLTKGKMMLPEIALAVDGRDGTIVAAAIVDGATSRPPARFATDLLTVAAEMDGSPTIGSDDEAIAGSLADATVVSRFTAGRLLAKAVGRGIGGVRLTYGPLGSTDPTRALRAKADQPLNETEAAMVLMDGVAAHNATRSTSSTCDAPLKP